MNRYASIARQQHPLIEPSKRFCHCNAVGTKCERVYHLARLGQSAIGRHIEGWQSQAGPFQRQPMRVWVPRDFARFLVSEQIA